MFLFHSIVKFLVLFCSLIFLKAKANHDTPLKPIGGTLFPSGGTLSPSTARLSVCQSPLCPHCPAFL